MLLKNVCFMMGYLVVMETYGTYFILISAFFCNVHSIGAINVCTNCEINRYNIDEFIQHYKYYVLFDTGSSSCMNHVTSGDPGICLPVDVLFAGSKLFFFQLYLYNNNKSRPQSQTQPSKQPKISIHIE